MSVTWRAQQGQRLAGVQNTLSMVGVGDKQISPDFFTYAEHVEKFNILDSPALKPDIFLQIILAVIAV